MRRRDLSQAVSEHNVRPDAEARPQRRERAFERVDGGLFPPWIVEVSRSAGTAEHYVEQRSVALFPQHGVATVEHRTHDWLALVERRTHTRPLAGLSCVDERHRRRSARCRSVVPYRNRPQPLTQGFRVTENHARPVAEMAPADAGRPSHVGEQRIGRRTLSRKRRFLLVEPSEVATRRLA